MRAAAVFLLLAAAGCTRLAATPGKPCRLLSRDQHLPGPGRCLSFRTLAAAYYDGADLSNPQGWLNALDATPGALGIMYTTWARRYQLPPAFGHLVSAR